MVDKNQLKVADQVDLADDDPFAELTRIMGFDPRQPARQAAQEKPAAAIEPETQETAEDDFSLDLEKELLGGFEFKDEIFGGSIPQNFRPAVEKGILEARTRGFLAGYPMVDFRVRLLDGQYHDVDSSELAFKIAGLQAFKEAARMAKPVLLEPMFAVEVITPDSFLGTVIGDINSRRGQIRAQEERHGDIVVAALVPLSEMFGYVGDLRSKTSGQASYSMEFDSYAEVPTNIADEIIKKARGE